jgi:hypothetical protein
MQAKKGNGAAPAPAASPIDEAIDAVQTKERDEAELEELNRLGKEASATFPKGWKVKLYDLGPGGVSVSIEFVVTTAPTAVEALRQAIAGYKEQAAADPENAKRVLGIVAPDGKPLA